MLQATKSRVLCEIIGFSIVLILPAALWIWVVDKVSNGNEYHKSS
jgi:hypothetical protein